MIWSGLQVAAASWSFHLGSRPPCRNGCARAALPSVTRMSSGGMDRAGCLALRRQWRHKGVKSRTAGAGAIL